MDLLGDEIVYQVAGGAALRFNAWVEFDTEYVRSPGSASTSYGKLIEVPMSKVAQPTKDDRITITMRPGEIYAPADVIEAATGETWRLPLKKVAA